MALLLRWWRSLLGLVAARANQHPDWVEPSNHITRAVLSGQTLWLPALPGEAHRAPAQSATPSEPLVAESVTAEAPPARAEEPAAAAPAPAKRTWRRFGRRAA